MVNYTAGSTRNGRVANESSFMNPFAIGDMNEEQSNYTAARVVETIDAAATDFVPAWTPVVKDKDGKQYVEAHNKTTSEWTKVEVVDGKATVSGTTYDKVRYLYDNVVIPQAQLPTLNAKVETIPLTAKARRIAIYYSQMAAYQA